MAAVAVEEKSAVCPGWAEWHGVQRSVSLHHLSHHAGQAPRGQIPSTRTVPFQLAIRHGGGHFVLVDGSLTGVGAALAYLPTLELLHPERYLSPATDHPSGLCRSWLCHFRVPRAQLYHFYHHRCWPAAYLPQCASVVKNVQHCLGERDGYR